LQLQLGVLQLSTEMILGLEMPMVPSHTFMQVAVVPADPCQTFLISGGETTGEVQLPPLRVLQVLVAAAGITHTISAMELHGQEILVTEVWEPFPVMPVEAVIAVRPLQIHKTETMRWVAMVVGPLAAVVELVGSEPGTRVTALPILLRKHRMVASA
jgi:hypothetical protein